MILGHDNGQIWWSNNFNMVVKQLLYFQFCLMAEVASAGAAGAPVGLSAKQQKLFELRMRMVCIDEAGNCECLRI